MYKVECVRNWQSMKQTQVVNGILGVNGVFESDDARRSCAGIEMALGFSVDVMLVKDQGTYVRCSGVSHKTIG